LFNWSLSKRFQGLNVNADLKLTHLFNKRRSKTDPPWAPFSSS
jgi:hypothetical protein